MNLAEKLSQGWPDAEWNWPSVDDYETLEWFGPGKKPSLKEIEAIEVPAARRKIKKSVVQQRLIDAGKMDAAHAALWSNKASFARWFAPDRPEVYADDPDALLLLKAIGADAETIMASE